MNLSYSQASEIVRGRLNLPTTAKLRIQKNVATALQVFSERLAVDPNKIQFVLSPRSTTTATPTNGVLDMASLSSTARIMIDRLHQGRIYNVNNTFTTTNVILGLRVSQAGTSDVNGLYSPRGTSAGRNYYNLVGQANGTSNWVIVWTGSQWSMADGIDSRYDSVGGGFNPWNVTWEVDTGSSPVPVVTQLTYLHITDNGLSNGQAVQFTTAGTLPSPLIPNTTYYVLILDDAPDAFILYTDPNDASTVVTLEDVGSGTQTIITDYWANQQPLQRLANPDLTPFPLNFADSESDKYWWQQGSILYAYKGNGVPITTGLQFSVPRNLIMTDFAVDPASQVQDEFIDALVEIVAQGMAKREAQ